MERILDLMPLLGVALRTRQESSTELARISGRPLDEVEAQLRVLEDLGFVSVVNGVIAYRRPDSAAAGLAEAVTKELGRVIDGSLDRLQAAFSAVPGLLDAWSEGSTDAAVLRTDVLHGPWAPADMWRLQFSRRVPRVSDACMPDTTALFAAQGEYQSSFWATQTGQNIQVRLLMSVTDATHPAGAERIQGELDSGVRIRMHPNLPSFFWVTDHDTVGLPLVWGESWPMSVMAVQSPAIAAIAGWVYDRLWSEAVPVEHREEPWEMMLTLMAQGMTMAAAASALGIAPRTGRRRVEEAMAHFDAVSQFSLGAAWGRARARGDASG